MANDYTFKGWVADDASLIDGNLTWKEYNPKTWEETDVDIEITHSGICGSDLHTLRDGWGGTKYPCVVGHEIVGKVIRVGSQAGDFSIDEVVGIGAQSDSCRSRDSPCSACESGDENYCKQRINTYDSLHRNGDLAQGGYARYARCPGHFVIKIPEDIAPEHAAPMLCGGVTVYSPLKRYGAGPGKSVGVIGVGGLGHFAVLFAKALGASRVVGISRREDKRQDTLELGADDYVATAENEGWDASHARSLDLIINTISIANMPLQKYLGLLALGGTFVQIGAPEEPLSLPAFSLIRTRACMTGSVIGSPSEIREMLQLASDQKIKPWIETRPMGDANQAVQDMADGKARYRYVLVN
ncbi:alcohol dehydrogenase superfamily zinc-type [Fusarium pseudocircinatum]|uniref:alcohol dehydrogenase (NADP(+)) n=1 Tax=Fusarium pseudocircinatum TaxID=56676 RepID=A0A8H5LFD9_9HYPO|nr:alcohol dehydrogenase superfamily zinc-type [Fusarium pseudocircinatum]